MEHSKLGVLEVLNEWRRIICVLSLMAFSDSVTEKQQRYASTTTVPTKKTAIITSSPFPYTPMPLLCITRPKTLKIATPGATTPVTLCDINHVAVQRQQGLQLRQPTETPTLHVHYHHHLFYHPCPPPLLPLPPFSTRWPCQLRSLSSCLVMDLLQSLCSPAPH